MIKYIVIVNLFLSGFTFSQSITWDKYYTRTPTSEEEGYGVSEDIIWLGTDKGLAGFESGTWTVYDTSNSNIPGNIIWVVKVNKDGLKLVGSHNSGITLFDDFTWTIYDTSNSPLPFNVIFDADFDKENIWIATPFGVAKTNGEKWEIFNSSNVDSLNIPLRIECDPYSNNVWIGAQTKG